MKVQCPGCPSEVPAVNVNLNSGWGKCDDCQEVFPLADVLPGFVAGVSVENIIERPFDARAVLEQTEGTLHVFVPPEGMRTSTVVMMAFATFWLGFVAFWTFAAAGGLAQQKPVAANWLMAAFSTPFWIAGSVLVGKIVWKLKGTVSMHLTSDGMQTIRKCLAWSRTKWTEIERVQSARKYTPKVQNEGIKTFGVEVVFKGGSFVLPVDSEAEEVWLAAEINQFLRPLAV